MNFENLITSITTTDRVLKTEAVKAINKALTARNWLVGLCIVEYEQNGEDRAEYGAKLLQKLSERFDSEGLSLRNLKLFRQFYQSYPRLGETIKSYLNVTNASISVPIPFGQTTSAQLVKSKNDDFSTPPDTLFNSLSFSHFVELQRVADPLKRTFYEIECIDSA